MKLIIILLSYIVSISGYSISQERSENAESSLLWEVSGNGLKKSSYLFGTHHFVSGKFVDTIEVFRNSLNSVNEIMVEIDTKNTDSSAILNKMFLGKDEYYSYADTGEEKMVMSYFNEIVGADSYYMFYTFKPIILAITMEYFDYFKEMRKTGEKDVKVDEYIQDFADKNSKSTSFFETGEQQLSFMTDSIPIKEQMLILIQYVKFCKSGLKPDKKELEKCYMQLDLNCLSDNALFHSLDDTYSRLLLQNRNLRWMKVINDRVIQKSLFIAVGALHLVGEYGLIELLRKEGYNVTPVKLN